MEQDELKVFLEVLARQQNDLKEVLNTMFQQQQKLQDFIMAEITHRRTCKVCQAEKVLSGEGKPPS